MAGELNFAGLWPRPLLMPLRLTDADAVVFDFNGTLSDDEDVLAEVFTSIAADLGVSLSAEEYVADFLGRSDQEICVGLLERAGADPARLPQLLAQVAEKYNAAVAVQPAIGPDACALVTALHELGKPLAVVTGASRATVLPALDSVGLLERFRVIVTEEDVATGKPDPEGLRIAARAMGLADEARVVVFEDSVPGLDAALAGGMSAVAVRGALSESQAAERGVTMVDGLGLGLLELTLS